MKRIVLVTLAAAAMSSTAYAADLGSYAAPVQVPAAPVAYDWSGFYFGGSVGVVESKSDVNIDYNSSDLEDPVGNWTDDNSFTGGVWHDVDGAELEVTESTPDPILALDELAPWLTQIDLSQLDYAGTVQVGGQWQVGNFVLGGELRGTFGEFGNSYSDSWSGQVSDSDSTVFVDDLDPENGDLRQAAIHPNGIDNTANVTWSGTSGFGENIFDDGDDITFDGVVFQSGGIGFGVTYDSYFAPVARVGIAADRWMFFAMGGPAVAEVTATTEAFASEAGVLSYSYEGGSQEPSRSSETETYEWEGSNTETLWGYTFGGGVEYAATDNAILRFEGSMTNFGSISVTGQSADTDAEYEVTQDVSNWALSTGISFKF